MVSTKALLLKRCCHLQGFLEQISDHGRKPCEATQLVQSQRRAKRSERPFTGDGRGEVGCAKYRHVPKKGVREIGRGKSQTAPSPDKLFKTRDLVSHYSAIGPVISCDAPHRVIGFRGKLFLRYPLHGLSLDCDRPLLRKEVGV